MKFGKLGVFIAAAIGFIPCIALAGNAQGWGTFSCSLNGAVVGELNLPRAGLITWSDADTGCRYKQEAAGRSFDREDPLYLVLAYKLVSEDQAKCPQPLTYIHTPGGLAVSLRTLYPYHLYDVRLCGNQFSARIEL